MSRLPPHPAGEGLTQGREGYERGSVSISGNPRLITRGGQSQFMLVGTRQGSDGAGKGCISVKQDGGGKHL